MTTTPRFNINGSSVESLFDLNMEVQNALTAVLHAMKAAAPHARDYQTLPAGAYAKAVHEHNARVDTIGAVADEISDITSALYDQLPDNEIAAPADYVPRQLG
jgi:hypothetical protein